MEKQITSALKKIEYGVYIVTMGEGQQRECIHRQLDLQVSSEPPIIALAVHNKHQSSRLLKEAGGFVINFIAASTPEVAKTYYGPAESGYQKLKSASVTDAPVTGAPILNGVAGFSTAGSSTR